eukprot:3806338-Amphidinium_carterae.1
MTAHAYRMTALAGRMGTLLCCPLLPAGSTPSPLTLKVEASLAHVVAHLGSNRLSPATPPQWDNSCSGPRKLPLTLQLPRSQAKVLLSLLANDTFVTQQDRHRAAALNWEAKRVGITPKLGTAYQRADSQHERAKLTDPSQGLLRLPYG